VEPLTVGVGVCDDAYEAETLPFSPEVGQDVGNLELQLDATHSLEEPA